MSSVRGGNPHWLYLFRGAISVSQKKKLFDSGRADFPSRFGWSGLFNFFLFLVAKMTLKTQKFLKKIRHFLKKKKCMTKIWRFWLKKKQPIFTRFWQNLEKISQNGKNWTGRASCKTFFFSFFVALRCFLSCYLDHGRAWYPFLSLECPPSPGGGGTFFLLAQWVVGVSIDCN